MNFGDIMSMANPQQAEPEEPPEENGGVPLPPGFTNDLKNFHDKAGMDEIEENRDTLAKSLQFTPIAECGLNVILSLFIFKNSLFMISRYLVGFVQMAFRALSLALSQSSILNIENRLILAASGFGLLIVTYMILSPLASTPTESFANVTPEIDIEPFLFQHIQ